MATRKITLNELRSLVKQIINEAKSEISPQLNDKITQRAKELYKENNGKTQKDFEKYKNMAIKEFGYQPKYYHDYMKKNFMPFDADDDEY